MFLDYLDPVNGHRRSAETSVIIYRYGVSRKGSECSTNQLAAVTNIRHEHTMRSARFYAARACVVAQLASLKFVS